MDNYSKISTLLLKQLDGSITEEEAVELADWSNQSVANARLLQDITDEESLSRNLKIFHPDNWKMADSRMKNRLMQDRKNDSGYRIAHRAHFLKAAWVRYAAAIIILFGIGAYLWNTQQKHKPLITESKPVPVKNDVAPGSTKATLTLSDGRKVELTPATETIAESGTNIQNANGRLEYGKADKVVFNTMSTPRGGQYQLTLPDGTNVWLNAASSITYPTAFIDNIREVTITGEAYFEVKKNTSKPFVVSVEGKPPIEVLGTHFNVNAYTDEVVVATTLLEGSVRTGNIILRPGQQARTNASNSISIEQHADVDKAIAWKNGVFDFDGADLKTVMRQLSRWYDLDVEYAAGVPSIEFGGKLKRDLNLSQILKVLENSAVNFDLEGRRLIVKP